MNVSIEQLCYLLGLKDVEIFLLTQQVAALQKRLAELEKKPEHSSLP